MKTRAELQTQFYKETGMDCVNSQGEFDIDYVAWLEDEALSSPPIEKHEPKGFEEWSAKQEIKIADIIEDVFNEDSHELVGQHYIFNKIASKIVSEYKRLSSTEGEKEPVCEHDRVEVDEDELGNTHYCSKCGWWNL